MRIERHPIGVWVREDGCIYLPQSGKNKAHWTYGSKNAQGYRVVGIAGKLYRVHRLVLEAFVGQCPEGFECNHKNRDRSDNRLENLEWVTHIENLRNTSQNDRVDARGGTHKYEDKKKYYRELDVRYRQTHRLVRFSDGSYRWVPLPEAEAYRKIPLKQRIFAK